MPVSNKSSVWDLPKVTQLCFGISEYIVLTALRHTDESRVFRDEITWTFHMESDMKFMSCQGQTMETGPYLFPAL